MMWKRIGAWIALALMMIGAVAVWIGDVDESVSLSAAMEVWGDVIRDVDQLGLSLSRVSDEKEMEFGRILSSDMIDTSAERSTWQSYVAAVGQDLVPHVQRLGIRYEFHVIETPWINAFAMPGGQIFISTGMLEFLQSEAELASILGHEIAHVDQRHCIEMFQSQITLERIGMDHIGNLLETMRRVLAVGYQKYQELEADAAGLRLAMAAGYDPGAIVSSFERLRERFGEPTKTRSKEPIGEITGSLIEALGSYFQSHPPTTDRISRLKQLIAHKVPSSRKNAFYIGKENYKKRIPKSSEQFDGETVDSQGKVLKKPQ
ncbi:MAG: M48 family metallopeptidase [Planctomycetes bacterium]|nr:M48 family metallopeptidase [Planctomycetota bacterium]